MGPNYFIFMVNFKIMTCACMPRHARACMFLTLSLYMIMLFLLSCMYLVCRLSFCLSHWLRSDLSIAPGSANFEILIKNNNFWLNFCVNKECPKLLCGLDIGHRRRQTIPVWNSSSGGRNSSGHHCMPGVCSVEHYVMTW